MLRSDFNPGLAQNTMAETPLGLLNIYEEKGTNSTRPTSNKGVLTR